ncbi:hypothetical protein FRB91_006828 [Serendipita sp. 411]|nr:hypothetical protein FRB91_006828 [Serendipita sp. 411]
MPIKNEGMPIFEGHGHGDLFIEFNVVLPTMVPDDMRKKLEDAFRHSGRRPKVEL